MLIKLNKQDEEKKAKQEVSIFFLSLFIFSPERKSIEGLVIVSCYSRWTSSGSERPQGIVLGYFNTLLREPNPKKSLETNSFWKKIKKWEFGSIVG